jgi:tetratricopeptide (TPR) repeat protein
MALGGCAIAPTKAPEPAPAIVSLQEYMQQGSKAATDGGRERARDTYRSAAKAYPASKEPWLKLAEDYFEATDYGNAILAAQEVMQRDASDNVAASILAVSGLRVSASALQSIRSQNRIAGNTRTEAETMARTLRDVLGETVLVPRPVAAASAPPATGAVRPRARPVAAQPAGKPAVAPAKTGSNPFDQLK